MKNMTTTKIFFYTILIFCISAFSYFPKSYSKYIKEKEDVVRYHVGIDSVSIGNLPALVPRTSSTYKQTNYVVQFNRGQSMKEGDAWQNIYITVQQAGCEITNVVTNGYKTFSENYASITYNSQGTDNIMVEYSCPVSNIIQNIDGTDYIYTDITIHEQFENEEPYLYAQAFGPRMPLSDYYMAYPFPTGEISEDGKELTLHVDTLDKYAGFNTWIKLYNNSYNAEIKKYISTVYNSEADILNTDKKLLGLTVTKSNDEYIYRLDDNFIGYARTYYSYIGPKHFSMVAFSNPSLTREQYDSIFKDYLTLYSGYSEEERNKVMSYIDHYGGIIHILTEETANDIKGLSYVIKTNEISVDSQLLLTAANAFADKKISILFDERPFMFEMFLNSINLSYNFITDDLYQSIINNTDIYMSIGLNNTANNEKVAYKDYFVIQDSITHKYILLNVYSDGITHTYVEIVELGLIELITVLENGKGLEISITTDIQDPVLAKTNVINVVKKLDEYFETSYEIEIVDNLFTSSTKIGNVTSLIDEENNNITISYTIQT